MKPWVALTQLGEDFDLVMLDVVKGDHKSAKYLDLNPLAVVSYLTVDHGTTALMPTSPKVYANSAQAA